LSSKTGNNGFTKQDKNDDVNIGIEAQNWDLIDQIIGPLQGLPTADKSSVINSITEVKGKIDTNTTNIATNTTQIGVLNDLTTPATDLVSAINDKDQRLGILSGLVYNVKDAKYGAVGDGSHDDTTTINNAISAANTAGGGIVYLPPGTYIVTGIKLYSKVHLIGSGRESTIIKLKDNTSSTDVIFSNNVYSLMGSGSTAGEYDFSIRDLTIDGNRVNNSAGASGYHCLNLYGYDYLIQNVRIRNATGKGIRSEWGASGTPSPNGSMESVFDNVKVYNCGTEGIDFLGPHDSMFTNVIVNNNNKNGWGAAGIHTSGQGLATFTSCHVWGTEHAYSVKLEQTGLFANCQLEGAPTNLLILANDCSFIGGNIFGFNTGDVGIAIGSGSVNIGGTLINTKVTNCQGGILNFVNESLGSYTIIGFYNGSYATTNGLIGTLATTSYLNLVNNAINGNNVLNLPQNAVVKVGYNTLNYPSDTKTDLSTLATGGVINSLQVVDGGYYYVSGTNNITINNIDETNVSNKKAKIYFIVEGNSTASITIKSTSNILTPNEVDFVISKANNLGDKLVVFTKPLSWSPEFRLSS
jgi:hypothetical protein